MSLKNFLTERANKFAKLDKSWPDCRDYHEKVNDDALTDAWLENGTTYIWKVGILAQWDSNKCDHAYLFIGHERRPGNYQYIGMLFWEDGENDDIGRSLSSYLEIASFIHQVFDTN